MSHFKVMIVGVVWILTIGWVGLMGFAAYQSLPYAIVALDTFLDGTN